MAFNTVSNQTVLARMKEAQDIPFKLEEVCGNDIYRTVDAHSKAIGSPHAFIFFPLLTVIASCMGVKATINVNQEWNEPPILWTVVAARKGEKKTPACKRLTKPISKLEQEMQDLMHSEPTDDDEDDAPSTPPANDKMPQLLVDYFSFEELYNLMSRNGYQILGVYDEVMALYQQLDLYKPSGCKIDKTTLLSLFNGSSWHRNFKNSSTSKKMPCTAFNYTGFIQPKFLIEMLQRDDQDGFYDRVMVACPEEILVSFRDLQVPMPEDFVDLYDVFKTVRNLHQESDDTVKYTFSPEAHEQFADMHDNLQQQKAATNDENKRGHLIKAITHLVRLSGIIHVMESAFTAVKDGTEVCLDTWNTIINVESLQRAWQIVNYTLSQKWALMPPSFDYVNPESDEGYLIQNSERIAKFLRCPLSKMSPSKALQLRCVPKPTDPITGKIMDPNVKSTVDYMEHLQRLGFGELGNVTTGKNKRSSKQFLKRKYQDLSETSIDHLKKIKVTREEYEKTEDAVEDDHPPSTSSTPASTPEK